MNHWQTKSSKVTYENPWIIVKEDEVIRPDGSDGVYGVVSLKSPSVFVVPVDDDGNTYISLQERYTTQQESWEIAAGAIDGQSYIDAAKRELLEETGIQAESIEELITIHVSVGYSDHTGRICLATGLKKVSDELDPIDGILKVRKLPLTEVRDMILHGEITDGVTISSILTVLAYLEKRK